jgi:hypothetical protein
VALIEGDQPVRETMLDAQDRRPGNSLVAAVRLASDLGFVHTDPP